MLNVTSDVRTKTEVSPAPARLAGLGKVSWAFADQALISATNFVTIILLARGLTQEGLGEFTLVYSALLFVNSIQSGIVTQPHNILGVARYGADYRLYTTSTAVSQLLLSVIAAGLSLLACFIAHLAHWSVAPLLLALAPTIVAWQFQEFVRRVLYTEARELAAFATDSIGYGGQVLAILYLGYHDRLTASSTFYAIAWTSAAATAYGLWEIRRSLCLRVDRSVILGNWHFGKWIAGGEIVGHWMSAQLFIFVAAAMLGAVAAGVLRIVHTVLGPCRVLADVMCTVLPIRFSRALATSGDNGLRTQMRLAYLVSVPLLGAYCLLVAVFARPILDFLYHGRYDDSASVLAIYSLAAFTSYLMMILAAALRAKRLTRELFDGQLWASVVSLPIGWLLIHAFGVKGTAMGMFVTYLAMIVLFDVAYRRAHEDASGAATSLGSGDLLRRLFALFDRANVPYCVTHGYQGYPAQVPSDVDCVMPARFVRHQLPALLDGNEAVLGARVVQWLREGTDYIVLFGHDDAGNPAHVALDISTDVTLNDRTFFSADQVLASRRRHDEFWVPAPAVEFTCTLLRRLAKRKLTDAHAARLSTLYREAPAEITELLTRHMTTRDAVSIEQAAASGDWSVVSQGLAAHRRRVMTSALLRRPLAVACTAVDRVSRRAWRHLRPRHGLHVVFLGPDGAGKSSVVRAVRERLGPAFFATTQRSFPPALLNRGDPNSTTCPHAEPPRSALSSAIRAVAYWWVYHAPGHLLTVRRDLARGRLVLHDRHLMDVQVDPRRYRYAGPAWVARLVCRFTPKPDLVVVLDAPADVIQSRKQEVELSETARQCAAYRELARQLGPTAATVDAGRDLTATVSAVESLILDRLADRTRRRLNTGESAARVELVRRLLPAGAQPWAVRAIGAGDQAFLYVATELAGDPTAPQVVKLYRPNKPEAATAAADEFAALRELHAAVDGATIDGWHVRTPVPLATSPSGTRPIAVAMDKVPGEPLQSLLADGRVTDDTIVSIARVLGIALRRYWSAAGRIYGDFNLDNVLCDPNARVISLVDPGMPERAFDCPTAARRWYPASRDLAYVLFDTATAIRSSLLKPGLRRRQWALVTALLRDTIRSLADRSDQRVSLLDEIRACCDAHLDRIQVPFSPRGLGRRLVRFAAAVRMTRLLGRLTDELVPPANNVPEPAAAEPPVLAGQLEAP